MKHNILALDLDGTLLTSDKKISENNRKALQEYMNAGGRLVLSTGRSYTGTIRFLKEIMPNAPVISNNGAILINYGERPDVLYEQGLEREDARKIYEMGEKAGVSMIIWCRFTLYGNRIDERLLDYGKRFGHIEPVLAPSLEELLDIGITKILWYTDENKAKSLYEPASNMELDSVTICNSEPMFLEFFNKKVSKAIVLKKVCEMYGTTLECVAAVGDGENDISMLSAADIGFAMANAGEYTKGFADRITENTNDEDGVAEVIRYLMSE